MSAIQAEKEYKWLESAKHHEQELNSQTGNALAATTWERIGYSYNLASRQANSSEEFKRLVHQSAEAYKKASQLFSKEETPESEGKSLICHALSEYVLSWLVSATERKEVLDRCIALSQKASIAFTKIDHRLNYARTCTLLSRCLYDLVIVTQKGDEKERNAQEGLEKATEATSIFSEFYETDEMVAAYSIAALHCYYLANVKEKEEERRDYAKRSLDNSEYAAILSKQTKNAYSNCLSMWAKTVCTLFFGENLNASLDYAIEMLQCASIIGDNYFKGTAYYLATYVFNWLVVAEEDSEKIRKIYQESIRYSEEAIKYFQLVNQNSELSEAYLFYVESYSFLAKEPAADQTEKLLFSQQAVKNGEKGLEYAHLSGSVDSIYSLLHALSKAYLINAKLEKERNQKIQLLRKALDYRKECNKIVQQTFEFNYWIIGNGLVYAAEIEADLAQLEFDQKTMDDLLGFALHDIESGVNFSNKWLNTRSVPSVVTVAAEYEDTFGRMLTERYLKTNEKEILTKANAVYNSSALKYREVDLPSRIAESYWKIAKNFDSSNQFQKAAENFEKAFAGYKAATAKILQFKDFYLDYATYMKAWSEIEMAKLAHSNEEYEAAMGHYEKSSQILKQSKSWMYLSLNFYSWSLLEQAEDLSRKENSRESIEVFQKAIKFLQESKRILKIKLEGIDKKDEKTLVERLIKVTETRSEFTWGRIAIEEAKDLDKQGEPLLSSEKYNQAANFFEKMLVVETGEVTPEATPLFYLCKAWEKMKLAEAKNSPSLYKEAAGLFSLANEHSSKESTSLMTLGHSNFCKAMAAGTEYESNQTMSSYEEATRYMEKAADYYLKAGFESTSDYAKATQRLFDAYVFMQNAKHDRDSEKQNRFYSMAEKALQTAEEYFEKANYNIKTELVQKLQKQIRDEKQLAISLNDIFHVPVITSSTASFSTISAAEENAVGLDRFEHADIQVKIVQQETEIKVGNPVTLEIQILNVGKEAISLTKIDNLVPTGFQMVSKPDYCKYENMQLTMGGKRLDPFKADEIKITLRPFQEGMFEIQPRIICSDWIGNQSEFKAEPIIFNVTSLVLPGRISTGYTDLNNLLFGGIPETYSVLLTSSSSDEREQLIRRFLETGLKKGEKTYFITSEIGNVADLAEEFQSNFSIFLCNSRADLMIKNLPNVNKLKGIENLTDIEIALLKSFRSLNSLNNKPMRFCITIISDILLQHHAVITRKWLNGLLPDLKTKGFTTLALITPEMHPQEDVQAILGLFDGEIRISEKETDKGIERFLRIRKLINQKYLENEINIKKEKI